MEWIDLIGTIAFAISGAMVAGRKGMDIFGVNILAVVTATGGGVIRDLLLGNVPPVMFRYPIFVLVSVITANLVFLQLYRHKEMPHRLHQIYETGLFWFDTLGLAAFTVDGVFMGIRAGYGNNLFLIVFVGVITGIGGGIIRDLLAAKMPDVFVKHVYAVASIAGALVCALVWRCTPSVQMAAGSAETMIQAAEAGRGTFFSMAAGIAVTILLRFLAAHYRWNLPRVQEHTD